MSRWWYALVKETDEHGDAGWSIYELYADGPGSIMADQVDKLSWAEVDMRYLSTPELIVEDLEYMLKSIQSNPSYVLEDGKLRLATDEDKREPE